MKERIVIEKELLKKIIKSSPIQWFDNTETDKNKIVIFGKEYQVEKEPTNWEELKELCRKLKLDCEVYITLQLTDKMKVYFYDNGEIIGAYEEYEYEFSLAKKRTPAQMWQIIKNLIGDEK